MMPLYHVAVGSNTRIRSVESVVVGRRYVSGLQGAYQTHYMPGCITKLRDRCRTL